MTLLILPDLLLLLLAFLILGVDLFTKDEQSEVTFHLSWAGLCALLLLLFCLPYDQQVYYLGTYVINGTSLLFKQIFVLSALFTVLLSQSYFRSGENIRGALKHRGEFNAILFFATAGMFAVVSASDLLTLFVGMELATIPLYILSGYHKRDHLSVEASTKYIILGSLATGLLLFGYSFLYGCCGSLEFDAILTFARLHPDHPLLLMAVFFIFSALGFKLTLFPFHMWAPDVYEGSPTPVSAFISVSSKATGIAFLLIIINGPLAPIHDLLQTPLLILAATTMTVGNLGALRQRNLRRFMAYSSIAQAGYIIMAMAGTELNAYSSIIYYLFVYGASNYAAFFIIGVVGRQRAEVFSSLRGLSIQSPLLAAILMLTMFSLAGIPPLAGFAGKFLLFGAAAEQGFYSMVIFAALNSTVSLYYYLLLVKEAYINDVPRLSPLKITLVQKSSLIILTGAMLLLGLIPTLSSSIVSAIQGG